MRLADPWPAYATLATIGIAVLAAAVHWTIQAWRHARQHLTPTPTHLERLREGMERYITAAEMEAELQQILKDHQP